jgi:hydrogenase nickel incorporation protein HypA/HybF
MTYVHELSLCDDLLSQVVAIAQQHQAQSVESITINIGALSGIEPSLVDTAFSLLKAGTVAELAKLIIHNAPVIVSCPHCNTQSEVAANRLLCPECQSTDTTLISGDEMILASVALFA